MFSRLTGEKWLGLLAIAAALLLIFVWVPLDTETGLIEKVRRQVRLGDSLGPVLAGGIILIGGIFTFVQPNADAATLTRHNLRWMVVLLGIITISLVLMRFAGPLVTSVLTETPYRALRATPPWNYIGYLTGGTFLIAALISVARSKITLSVMLVGIVVSLVFALLYDLPFDDLQLPPNGDV